MTTAPGDPDYTLRWPAELFSDEARRLVAAGRSTMPDDEWREAVETLLRQAFVGSKPIEEFARRSGAHALHIPRYDNDEPF